MYYLLNELNSPGRNRCRGRGCDEGQVEGLEIEEIGEIPRSWSGGQ